MYCTKCGKQMDVGDKFCSSCGYQTRNSDISSDQIHNEFGKVIANNPKLLEVVAIEKTSQEIEKTLGKEKADRFVKEKLKELAGTVRDTDDGYELDSTDDLSQEDKSVSDADEVQLSIDQNYFSKFIKGNFGLLKTFWIYNVIPLYTLTFLTDSTQGFSELILVLYLPFSGLALWRASSNYSGLKLWSILSKVIAVLFVLQLPAFIFNTMILPNLFTQ